VNLVKPFVFFAVNIFYHEGHKEGTKDTKLCEPCETLVSFAVNIFYHEGHKEGTKGTKY